MPDHLSDLISAAHPVRYVYMPLAATPLRAPVWFAARGLLGRDGYDTQRTRRIRDYYLAQLTPPSLRPEDFGSVADLLAVHRLFGYRDLLFGPTEVRLIAAAVTDRLATSFDAAPEGVRFGALRLRSELLLLDRARGHVLGEPLASRLRAARPPDAEICAMAHEASTELGNVALIGGADNDDPALSCVRELHAHLARIDPATSEDPFLLAKVIFQAGLTLPRLPADLAQPLAVRIAGGDVAAEVVYRFAFLYEASRDSVPLPRAQLERVERTGAWLPDIVEGDVTFDSYLFAELDHARAAPPLTAAAVYAALVGEGGTLSDLLTSSLRSSAASPAFLAANPRWERCGVAPGRTPTALVRTAPWLEMLQLASDAGTLPCGATMQVVLRELIARQPERDGEVLPWTALWERVYVACRYQRTSEDAAVLQRLIAEHRSEPPANLDLTANLDAEIIEMFERYAFEWLEQAGSDPDFCRTQSVWARG